MTTTGVKEYLAAFSRYGLWTPMLWLSWVNTNNVFLPEAYTWCTTYLGLTISLIIIALAGFLHTVLHPSESYSLRQSRFFIADGVTALVMSVSGILVVSPWLFDAGSWLALIGSLTGGLACGRMYARWALCLSGYDLRELVRYIFGSTIIWTVMKTASYSVSISLAAIIVALIPLFSFMMLHTNYMRQQTTMARTGVIGVDTHFATWKLWTVVMVTTAVVWFLIGTTRFHFHDANSPIYILKGATSIGLYLILICWTLRREFNFNYVLLWRAMFILVALALLTTSMKLDSSFAWFIPSIAADMLIPVVWLTVCDIARHSNLSPYLTASLGLLAYAIPSFLGNLFARVSMALVMPDFVYVLLMFVLLVTLAFCLDPRDPDLISLFRELRGQDEIDAAFQSIEERCKLVAQQYELAPREREVMHMLCMGRSRSYMAETLMISENTVKTYVDRLYKKLDVHSRSELQEFVGI